MRRHASPLTALLAALLSGAALAGCRTMAPDYARPALPVADVFPDAGAQEGRPAAEIPWREFFGDERLRSLVQLALANNRDLRSAVLNIERARALYRIQRSELYPTIEATATGQKGRVPNGVGGAPGALSADQYFVGGVVSWELDLFGRVRSLTHQALQIYLATEQARRSVHISLVSEVAQVYLLLVADRELLELARSTLETQRAALELTRRRLEVGVADALAVRQAQTSVETARVDVARYTAFVAQDRNALEFIVGTPVPPALLPDGPLERVGVLPEVPAGLPSDLLQRRPDILAAEHELRGAYANIGAARAQLFPRIGLTADGGTASGALSGLFGAGSAAWSFVSQITSPIFDAGRNRARLRVARVDRDLAVASYEQAIQRAFREVADALAERSTLDERLAAQQALVEATADSYRLSGERFRVGVDSYLPVLDSQRSLYDAQRGLIDVRLTRVANLVTLYRVLGGGWTDPGTPVSAPVNRSQP